MLFVPARQKFVRVVPARWRGKSNKKYNSMCLESQQKTVAFQAIHGYIEKNFASRFPDF